MFSVSPLPPQKTKGETKYEKELGDALGFGAVQ